MAGSSDELLWRRMAQGTMLQSGMSVFASPVSAHEALFSCCESKEISFSGINESESLL